MIGIKPVCLVVIYGWGVSESVDVKGDAIRSAKLHKDKSAKRRLSIYDDFADENLNELDFNYRDDQFDEE